MCKTTGVKSKTVDRPGRVAKALMLFLLYLPTSWSIAQPPGTADSFEQKVRPILLNRCVDCHSGEAPKGGLDLTSRSGLLKGSDSGPVVETDDPAASLLLEVVSQGIMPPREQDRLQPQDVAYLESWIRQGAPWSGGVLEPGSATTDRRAGRDFWSLQPPRSPPVPETSGQHDARNPIDSFVLQGLESAGLKPAPPADRRTLIRRLSFDLLGLPPTPDEVQAFLDDPGPDAVDRLVDRLLASARFGERWARHWLDVVRFAESHGYEHDSPRPAAWHYRDAIIHRWNQDQPFDRFIAEQLAGDVLAPHDHDHDPDPDALAATGFLVAGPYDEVGSKVKSALMRANVRQDELEDMIGVIGQAFLGLTIHCARCHDHKFDPIPQEDYYRLQAVLAGVRHGGADADQKPPYRPVPQALEPTRLLRRGDVQSPGKEVQPGAPRAVASIPPSPFFSEVGASEGARRRALANWITDKRNPLTARVIVNRLWQHHFGQGLVATPSDYGFNGARPTHPQLLDWLATRLMENGWRLKPIHRMILLSAAYQRSCQFDTAAASRDADNSRLWRFSPRRISAEEVRDAILAVGGQLNPRMGGPGYSLFESKTNAGTLYRAVDQTGWEFQRRAIYRTVVRGTEAPLLSTFDCPDSSTTTPARAVTTTPLQALGLWNDPFVIRQAHALAARLEQEAADPGERVDRAYQLLFCRPAKNAERNRALDFVARHDWAALCRVLLNSSEFLVIDDVAPRVMRDRLESAP